MSIAQPVAQLRLRVRTSPASTRHSPAPTGRPLPTGPRDQRAPQDRWRKRLGLHLSGDAAAVFLRLLGDRLGHNNTRCDMRLVPLPSRPAHDAHPRLRQVRGRAWAARGRDPGGERVRPARQGTWIHCEEQAAAHGRWWREGKGQRCSRWEGKGRRARGDLSSHVPEFPDPDPSASRATVNVLVGESQPHSRRRHGACPMWGLSPQGRNPTAYIDRDSALHGGEVVERGPPLPARGLARRGGNVNERLQTRTDGRVEPRQHLRTAPGQKGTADRHCRLRPGGHPLKPYFAPHAQLRR